MCTYYEVIKVYILCSYKGVHTTKKLQLGVYILWSYEGYKLGVHTMKL